MRPNEQAYFWQQAFSLLEQSVVPRYGKDAIIEKANKAGRYPFIPLYTDEFFRELEEVKQVLPPSRDAWFVDVGCGIGSKLILARLMGFYPFGVEIVPEYAAIAQRAGFQVAVEDARKHNYSQYDVIYFYRPFEDEKRQRQLERQIVSTAKSGALILPNLKSSALALWGGSKSDDTPTEYVRNFIWRKR